MGDLWRDMRFGFRSLVKSPGFTLVALVPLALGIGANTAIFSVVDAVLLHPLPYPEPNRLVALYTTDAQHNQFDGRFSYALYRQLQTAIGAQSKTAAYATWPFTITRPGEPSVVLGLAASADLFPMLGVRPMLGHIYTAEDEQAARPVVVISEDVWRKRFQADPSIIGRTIELDHRPHTIVGVLSAKLRFPMLPGTPDVWLPLSSASLGQMLAAISNSLQSALPGANSGNLSPDQLDVLDVIGRLKDGATAAQVQAATIAVVKNFAKASPDQNSGTSARVAPLAQEVEKGYRTALLLLFGAVGLVLLIACANVANLMVARVTAREREMALRMALGAGKRRIVRQMLVESVELSLAGGAAGAYLAYLTLTNLGHLIPQTLGEVRGATLNGHVLAFSAAVSIGAGLLFGLFPGWAHRGPESLRAAQGGGPRAQRLRLAPPPAQRPGDCRGRPRGDSARRFGPAAAQLPARDFRQPRLRSPWRRARPIESPHAHLLEAGPMAQFRHHHSRPPALGTRRRRSRRGRYAAHREGTDRHRRLLRHCRSSASPG